MIKIDILIPVYNESERIEGCLDSVFSFEIPSNTITNIFVIDGMSQDDTLSKIKKYQENNKNLFILSNPNKIQSCALNIGIKQSNADFILRLDAYSSYPKDYLANCLDTSLSSDADNVGGLAITEPGNRSLGALVVQAITTSKFGVGNSGFRVGALEGQRDTVPYGFFKRKIFDQIGLFNERLERAQDYEFNQRIKKNGGLIWFNPNIFFYYYNQKSLFKFLRKQLKYEAPYNAYMWYLAPYTFNLRHSITLFFFIGIILGCALTFFQVSAILTILFISILSLYFVLGIFFSFVQYKRYKRRGLIAYLPFSFFLFHFIHGLGIFIGILKLALLRSPVQNKAD